MDRNSKQYGICFDRRSQNFGFHMIARSQLIAVDRSRSQTIAEDRTWFYLLRSSAIVCDHDRRIADDRRSGFPYDRRRSQNILRSAICDPRSSAIIWKPALNLGHPQVYLTFDARRSPSLARKIVLTIKITWQHITAPACVAYANPLVEKR